MSLQSLIDHPKELLELIDSCLKPKVVETKKFGEVFTPMRFIDDKMLHDLQTYYNSKYGRNIFEDETLKWADTTAGMGNFPVAIYYKLMEGLKLKIPIEKNRKKHILENMLYLMEINQKNCFIMKQIFDINNDYKLNLYVGDSLEVNITQKAFNIDKFDIVIGNPPYNEELNSKKGSATALYSKFIEYYIDKCDLLCFLIPSRWFSGGKGLNTFRKNMLARNDIVFIKHFDDASKIFGNSVSIEGGINYFLKDANHNDKCMYNGSMTKMNKYDVFIDHKYCDIIDCLSNYVSIENTFIGQSYSGINSNDKRLKDVKTHTTLKCYVSQQKGFEKFIEIEDIKKNGDFNKWKLITARANGGNKCFGNMFIGKPNELCNQSYILFEVQDEFEAKSLLSYMKCRLPNFMLSLRKSSQDICESTCKWIPLPPLNQNWTDNDVYEYFKLKPDDIKLIKETKIIGYKDITVEKIDVSKPKIVLIKRKKIISQVVEDFV